MHLSEGPGVLPPHEVQLAGHREQQRGQVRHREVEQVDVGRGPHVSTHGYISIDIYTRVYIYKYLHNIYALVPQDHDAGGEVAQHSQH